MPQSILGCFDADTGKFDFDKFFAYSRFRSHQTQEITQGIIAQEADNYTKDNDYYEGNYGGVQPPQAKKTRRRKYVMARCVENGELERIKPT